MYVHTVFTYMCTFILCSQCVTTSVFVRQFAELSLTCMLSARCSCSGPFWRTRVSLAGSWVEPRCHSRSTALHPCRRLHPLPSTAVYHADHKCPRRMYRIYCWWSKRPSPQSRREPCSQLLTPWSSSAHLTWTACRWCQGLPLGSSRQCRMHSRPLLCRSIL